MKKITSFIAAMLATVALAGAAQAISIPSGAITFHWTNFEDRITATGQTLQGVFSLDQITQTGSNTSVWQQGQGGEYLFGYFNNLLVSTFGGESVGTTTTFTGGNLSVIKTNSDFDLSKDATIYSDLATAGSLWLTADFVTGGDFLNPTKTLVSSITSVGSDGKTGFLAIKGTGSSLLDVTGGAMFNIFDSNSYTRYDGSGLFADLSMVNTFSIINTGTPLINKTFLGWDVVSSDPINAIATPEPGTLALLGIGLMGMAIYGKRRINR